MNVQESKPRNFLPGLILAGILVVAGITALALLLRAPTAPIPDYQRAPVMDMNKTGPFDYAAFGRVARKYVDERGMVDYQGIKEAPQELDSFLAEVKRYSPDRNLAMFVEEDEALAYWINAYNAWMIKIVADNYPVASVQDIGDRPGAVFDEKLCVSGGKEMSLNDIETGIIRARFGDPRAHFALNCASLGCPPMPREPFLPGKLDEQLQRGAKDFFGRRWYCHVADDGKTVRVSSILKWYGEDFLDWLKGQGEKEDVRTYIAMYAPEDVRKAIWDGAEVEFIEYDWRLTDQAASWSKVERR